ncbi:MAG: TrkA C-terminal domain-containing protein [Christensenellales bacterium]
MVAKASQDIHAKLLLRNGADDVVYPERDSAERMATRLSAQNVFDYIELTDEYSIYEIAPLENWVGHSIREVDVRNKYHINILGVKESGVSAFLPGGDYQFTGNEHLLAMAPARTRRSAAQDLTRFDELGLF